jgi:hypothetical protein
VRVSSSRRPETPLVDPRKHGSWRWRSRIAVLAGLAALLLLAACAPEDGIDQPLSALNIRARLAGHSVIVSDNGGRFYLSFAPNGVARYEGETAEFVQWRAAEGDGLCLKWHDRPETCAPLYQLNVAHFRWGDMLFNDLDAGMGPGEMAPLRGFGR